MQICETQDPPNAVMNAYTTKNPISIVKTGDGSKTKTHTTHRANSDTSVEGISTLLTVLTARPGYLGTPCKEDVIRNGEESATYNISRTGFTRPCPIADPATFQSAGGRILSSARSVALTRST
jgi:hypothetical protein